MKFIMGRNLWLMLVSLPTAVMAASQYLNVPDLPHSYNSPDLPPGKPLVGDALTI